MSRFFVFTLLLLSLAACAPPDDTPARVDCPPPPAAVVIREGWRFQTDPQDDGLANTWFAPDFDDSAWQPRAPGRAWEFDDIAYDGVAWYRGAVALLADETYLSISSIDDAAALWVNGVQVAAWGPGQLGDRAAVLSLHDYGAPGAVLPLALRVEDFGGYGGIKDPLRLGGSVRAVLTPAQWVGALADAHPDWALPGWTRGRPLAWTMTGGLDTPDEALVSMDGAVAPWARAPVVEAWLYNPASGELSAAPPSFSLLDGQLPVPQWSWSAQGVTISSTLFHDARDATVRWLLRADVPQGTPPLSLLVAVRPFAVNRAANPITTASIQNPARLWLNGAPFMVASAPPRQAGVGTLDAVMDAALAGRAPAAAALDCAPEGDGAALLVYDLNGSTALSFAFPTAPGGAFPPVDVDTTAQLGAAQALWAAQTARVGISIPDGRISAALHASLGYLLLASDPDGPHPGPLAHDALWVRDAAYMGLALLNTGHADTARRYVAAVFAGQEPDGRVPPIQGDNVPWNDDEWDSQGQAIFLVTQVYRFTGDGDFLHQWYPQVRLAAQFLRDLRARNADAPGALRGILPPSLSAEDLGPADQHYYWDNFWALAGLEEAAFAAALLGETGDATWMQAEADALRRAVLDSITRVMGDPPAYVPAAVEDLDSSGMARGTVPALSPYPALPPDLPLLARAFDLYHQRWIAPYNGGFLHREGQFWTYGGLELAHAYLLLNRGDVVHQILGWTLDNQTLPGTFAWGEQVDPLSKGFTGGDMPHGWAAASFITLIRQMLVGERGGALALFSSAPDWWFAAPNTVALDGLPTYFGALTLRTGGDLQIVDGRWRGTLTLTLSGAAPPEGFFWRIPHPPAQMDGVAGARYQDGVLWIPGTGGDLRLTFAP